MNKTAPVLAVLVAIVTLAGVGAGAMLPRADAGPSAAPQSRSTAARVIYPSSHMPMLVLPDGTGRAVRSLLRIAHPLRHGDYVWDDAGVPPGPVWVRVDLSRQLLSVFRAGHEIGATLIVYGAGDKPTPTGVYPILERASQHRSTLYQADMPYTLRLTMDGVAVHASTVRPSAATHGCIGVPLPFARLLFEQARVGDPVAITGAVLPQGRVS